MAFSERFLPPIPEGHKVYYGGISIAGLQHNPANLIAFIKGKKRWLDIAPEPKNKHDKNAIVVLGINKGFFGTKKRKLGYVPRDIAEIIAKDGTINNLDVRLRKIYVSKNDDYAEVEFDLTMHKSKF